MKKKIRNENLLVRIVRSEVSHKKRGCWSCFFSFLYFLLNIDIIISILFFSFRYLESYHAKSIQFLSYLIFIFFLYSQFYISLELLLTTSKKKWRRDTTKIRYFNNFSSFSFPLFVVVVDVAFLVTFQSSKKWYAIKKNSSWFLYKFYIRFFFLLFAVYSLEMSL